MLHEGRHLAWLDQSARQSQPVRSRIHPPAVAVPSECLHPAMSHCALSQLEEGTELKLPLWLVEPLAKRQHVDLQLPKFYGAAYRNALRADAAHLNLSNQSDFYFEVGAQLSQLVDDSGDLGSMLLAGFANRFHGLLDASLNVTSKVDSTAIKEKLTLREKQRAPTRLLHPRPPPPTPPAPSPPPPPRSHVAVRMRLRSL